MRFGSPDEDVPGKNVILPKDPGLFRTKELDLDHMRRSLIKKSAARANGKPLTAEDIKFLAEDARTDEAFVKSVLDDLKIAY